MSNQHTSSGDAGAAAASSGGPHTLADLPKSWRLTSILPPDPVFPTPAASHKTPRDNITPRQVREGLFTWVRPATQTDPELLAVSPAALRDLNIAPSEAATAAFTAFAAGNTLLGWDDEKLEGGYPWAQLYGGFQFGQWAGQLGDGRAISLFETAAPATRDLVTGAPASKFEVQLKGAGLTPYSRFADGKAVLRSSIREWVVSEALHALRIPSTRALALTLLPHNRVLREDGFEPGAIVARFAQSWMRLGNFDILRARGERALIRTLATYVGEEVLGGWERLPGRLSAPEKPADAADLDAPARAVGRDEVQGPKEAAENRFARLYREVVRRNAKTVANWQAYGFMNGVLNTDNTSVYGLSIDFGPFAFMDNFYPAYTPNHDDHLLRYSYRNQPTIIWWNLVRFGEALGELIGAGATVDTEPFVTDGVQEGAPETDELVARAEKLITQAGEEYKAVFLAEYKRLMGARLGLRTVQESDFAELFSELLDTMEALELDFNHFFRRLSALRTADLATVEARRDKAGVFFHKEGISATGVSEADARTRVGEWLDKWRTRIVEEWGVEGEDGTKSVGLAQEEERTVAMKLVNPSFIPRSFILDEIIKRVEKQGGRDVLRRVMHMALHPFEDSWHGKEVDGAFYEGDAEEEARWTGDVPKFERAMQCSCSS